MNEVRSRRRICSIIDALFINRECTSSRYSIELWIARMVNATRWDWRGEIEVTREGRLRFNYGFEADGCDIIMNTNKRLILERKINPRYFLDVAQLVNPNSQTVTISRGNSGQYAGIQELISNHLARKCRKTPNTYYISRRAAFATYNPSRETVATMNGLNNLSADIAEYPRNNGLKSVA